jgi:hypothetical protein
MIINHNCCIKLVHHIFTDNKLYNLLVASSQAANRRAAFVSQHTRKRSGNFLPDVVIHMPGFTGLNFGKTVNFIVTTVRLSNLHDLKVTECSSFSFSHKHCSYYTNVFNQDTENITLGKIFVSCVAWVLTPCGHVWCTATIRNKKYESIHNPIHALCYRQSMTYINYYMFRHRDAILSKSL